jgi:hypothetical protein
MPGLVAVDRVLRSSASKNVDGRDAVLRTAMPGHDVLSAMDAEAQRQLVTPFSLKYFTAPGWKGIGDFFCC